MPHFGMQADTDALFAVELFHRYFIGKVRSDNAVQQIQPCQHHVNGQTAVQALTDLLKLLAQILFHFFFRQVIDHIDIDTFRLYGQCPPFHIHDKTVRSKALRPFLVGKIDW